MPCDSLLSWFGHNIYSRNAHYKRRWKAKKPNQSAKASVHWLNLLFVCFFFTGVAKLHPPPSLWKSLWLFWSQRRSCLFSLTNVLAQVFRCVWDANIEWCKVHVIWLICYRKHVWMSPRKKVTVLSLQCELLCLQININSLECSTRAAFCILQSEFCTLSKEIPSLSDKWRSSSSRTLKLPSVIKLKYVDSCSVLNHFVCLQVLARRLRFQLERAPGESSLIDRTGRTLKMEPLATVGDLERYLLKMVSLFVQYTKRLSHSCFMIVTQLSYNYKVRQNYTQLKLKNYLKVINCMEFSSER